MQVLLLLGLITSRYWDKDLVKLVLAKVCEFIIYLLSKSKIYGICLSSSLSILTSFGNQYTIWRSSDLAPRLPKKDVYVNSMGFVHAQTSKQKF